MNNSTNNLVLALRGLPGSGKTTLIMRLKQKSYGPSIGVFSADHYKYETGNYVFDPKTHGEHHLRCFTAFHDAATEKLPQWDMLVVDNTNIAAWELAGYERITAMTGRRFVVVTLLCDVNKAFERNTHSVPGTTMMLMHRIMLTQELPSHWQHVVLSGQQIDEFTLESLSAPRV